MSCVLDLVSIAIIEKDFNNDILWSWAYPKVASEIRSLIISKCGLENIHKSSDGHNLVTFYYCHHQQYWFYLCLTDVYELSCLQRVKQFIMFLQSRDFNPEKYESLLQLLSKVYCTSGNPVDILQLYLSVLLRGVCPMEDGRNFSVKQFDKVTAYSCVPAKGPFLTNIYIMDAQTMARGPNVAHKDIVKTFGLETILIYTALLLKKRIVVYHHSLDTLLWFVRALPAFMWHRQDWNIIYPYVELTPIEISELLSKSNYIAGFKDAAVERRTELYDVFVNLPAIEITIAPHAKEMFIMTKTHKEIAVFMTAQAENNSLNEKTFIKEIAKKTTELLNKLSALATLNENGEKTIQMSIFQEKKCAPALQNFLHNLAAAEGYAIE